MAEYYPAALAIVAMELQQTPPMIQTDTSETSEPQQEDSVTITAETKRTVVGDEIVENGSFHGQGYELIYISAPALAEVLDVTNETARRRLNYFEEQGVLRKVMEGRPNYYHIRPEFTAVNDDNVRPESEIITTAKKLLEAATEG